jgi:hypothetical protein
MTVHTSTWHEGHTAANLTICPARKGVQSITSGSSWVAFTRASRPSSASQISPVDASRIESWAQSDSRSQHHLHRSSSRHKPTEWSLRREPQTRCMGTKKAWHDGALISAPQAASFIWARLGDRMVFAILAVVAELERSGIVERVKAGWRNRRVWAGDAARIAALLGQGLSRAKIVPELGISARTSYEATPGLSTKVPGATRLRSGFFEPICWPLKS